MSPACPHFYLPPYGQPWSSVTGENTPGRVTLPQKAARTVQGVRAAFWGICTLGMLNATWDCACLRADFVGFVGGNVSTRQELQSVPNTVCRAGSGQSTGWAPRQGLPMGCLTWHSGRPPREPSWNRVGIPPGRLSPTSGTALGSTEKWLPQPTRCSVSPLRAVRGHELVPHTSQLTAREAEAGPYWPTLCSLQPLTQLPWSCIPCLQCPQGVMWEQREA